MSASTSQYRIFDTIRFRNAPVSKIWALSTLAGSICLIPFRHRRSSFTLSLTDIPSVYQWITMAMSKVFMLEFKDVIAGCLLIYFMRHVERRFGSRKYADFLILTGLTAFSLEMLIHCALNFGSSSPQPLTIAYGPYALLFSAFMQFYSDVPFVPYATVFSVPLSVKNLPLLFSLQMLISTKDTIISCLSGLIAGFLYRCNFLGVQSLSIVPGWLCKSMSSVMKPILQLGENTTGRLLPIGATLEAQRQDIYDRYEQSLIYGRIQRQQQIDEGSNADHLLRTGQRLFGRNAPQQPTIEACEEKVRTLVEMGFSDRNRVEQVLRNTNNDLNSAALVLLQDAASTIA